MPNFLTDVEPPQPLTKKERINLVAGKAFFWYFLDHIFTRSFDGQTYTDPVTKDQKPFEFSDIHRQWALHLQYNKRFCIQAPRAHLKTTVIGQAFPFWLMAQAKDNDYVDGIYFSYKTELANEKVAALKRAIKDNPYCRFWVDLKPTSASVIDFLVDWGDGPIAEVTLKGAGIKSATRGRHPRFTLCDDILSDFANPIGSSELRLINRIFRNTIMSLPANEDDVLGLVGTPQSYDDILYQLAQAEDWLWLLYPAIKDYKKQTVQWPEKFDYERLLRIRKNVGITGFEVEYQLTPVVVTDQFLTKQDLLPIIDLNLKEWNLTTEFGNEARLGVYGGFDVGKKVHPSHVVILLELPSKSLITLYQAFMDHMPYPQQVKMLNLLAQRFNISRGYFDSTFNVLEDRKLNRRWKGKVFTKKLKADMAVGLEKRVFAEDEDPGLVLLNDSRFINQIVQVRKDLTADETMEGHGDAFWSLGLAIKAADDGPSIIDIGNPRRLIPDESQPFNPRTTAYQQLTGSGTRS